MQEGVQGWLPRWLGASLVNSVVVTCYLPCALMGTGLQYSARKVGSNEQARNVAAGP